MESNMAAASDTAAPLINDEEIVAHRVGGLLIRPIEAVSALLLSVIIVLLLAGVASRYVFSYPVVWIDEVASISFLWLAMLGSAIAIDRNEHLRLTLFTGMFPRGIQGFIHTLGLVLTATFLLVMLQPAVEYVTEEWYVTSAALNIPNSFRVSAIAFGIFAMLGFIVSHAVKTSTLRNLAVSVALVAAIVGALWFLTPALLRLGNINILIFLVGVVAVCLVMGVPIAFCFGIGTLAFLAFSTQCPDLRHDRPHG
jgi:TRAP-type C4-dicarboxylate transport system permease small subunit